MIDIVGAVSPRINKPVMTTNDALVILQGLGILGGVEKDLMSPASASVRVVIYWSYTPPKK